MSDQPDKFEATSARITDEQKAKLASLFPEIVTEGGKIDFDRLKLTLGETVDAGKERYGMNWPGKADCFKTIQRPSMATLVPVRDESLNFDTTENLLIEGDNLETLKLLQKAYLGRVKMIYIDPPYNTGKDFIYPDNYSESLETYLRYTGQVDEEGNKFSTNTETDGRFHSKWMNMMYPRLFLARNLLSNNGAIFISIDDHEMENLKKLCNEIFGEENFFGLLGVVNNLKGRNDRKNIATCNEYLLIYGKSQQAELGGLPLTEEQKAEYKYTDVRGEKYALRDLRKRGRPDRRVDRPKMWFPIYFNETTNKCSLERTSHSEIEITPKRGDGSDGRWRWGRDRIAASLAILEPRYSKKNDRWDIDHRVYLTDATPGMLDGEDDLDEDEEATERSSKSKSFWVGGEISTDVGRRIFKELFPEMEYDYPKAVDFLKRCLHLGLGEDDIVLDFFAGSGTTAQAVLELNREDGKNRKFVLVQLPEPIENKIFPTISAVTKERVRRVTKQLDEADQDQLLLGQGKKQDRGFKVFKLQSSNFKAWNSEQPKDDAELVKQLTLHVDHLVDGRTQEDVLYELLLKSGFPLNTRVEKRTLAGKIVFSVADGAMLICLEKELTAELLKVMADNKPERVVCLDAGFADNDQLKTNAVQLMKAKGVTKFQTV